MANLLNSVRTYKEVKPRKQKSSYSPFEGIDFLIKLDPGFELVKNSICVHCNLVTTRGGAAYNPTTGRHVYLDPFSGGHSLFQLWQTDINGETKEVFEGYGRRIRMMVKASKDQDELGTNLMSNIELKCESHYQTPWLLRGSGNGIIPVNIKPYICLNRSNRNIGAPESGVGILVHTRLPPPDHLFFGDNARVADVMDYEIQDLLITYQVQPLQPTNQPLVMGVTSFDEFSLVSQTSNVEIELPLNCQNMSCCFAKEINTVNNGQGDDDETSHYNATNYLNLDLVKFLMNDSNNNLLSFELKDLEEQLMNYLASMNSGEISDVRLSKMGYEPPLSSWINFSSFGVGLSFAGIVPKGTKVSCELQANVDGNEPTDGNPYNMYVYFNGLVEL